jgi:hypothetical protein
VLPRRPRPPRQLPRGRAGLVAVLAVSLAATRAVNEVVANTLGLPETP